MQCTPNCSRRLRRHSFAKRPVSVPPDLHRPHHQHLLAGLDWHVFRQLIKKMPKEHRTFLKTWVQGAIHFREQGKTKQCPICGVPATPKHIVWMCKWHHGRGHKPMPPEWAERITQHDEEPLWNAGWIPLEPQDQRTIQHPYQGHGITLDATPSTYDLRSQLWVFGLCAHVLCAGQLQRLGAITGVPENPQTKTRALIAGLAALAQRTSTPVKVIVQVAAVWEAWTNPNTETNTRTCTTALQLMTFRGSLSFTSAKTHALLTHLQMSRVSRGGKGMLP